MTAGQSLANEHELCNTSKSSIKKPLKNSSKFTAVTIKLNTAPWKYNGTVNEETVYQIIHNLYKACDAPVVLHPVKWELDTKCQLHCHTTLETKKTVFRNKVLSYIKEHLDVPNYHIFLKPIANQELVYWQAYCNKVKVDVRPLYYRIVQFYRNPKVIEDFSDLADYDIEYNSKTGHFQHIDTCKAKFDW